jgi:hypothetical protein
VPDVRWKLELANIEFAGTLDYKLSNSIPCVAIFEMVRLKLLIITTIKSIENGQAKTFFSDTAS